MLHMYLEKVKRLIIYNKGKMSHNLEWKEYDTTHAFPTHHPNIDSRAVLSKFFASKLN